MDQIAGGVAGENRSLTAQARPLESQHTAGRREAPGMEVRGGPVTADGVYLASRGERPRLFCCHISQEFPRRQPGVGFHEARLQHCMTQMMAVVANKPVPPGIERVAKLPRAGGGLQLRAIGPETKIHAGQVDIHPRRITRTPHLARPQAAGYLHPATRCQDRKTGPQLRIGLSQTLEQHGAPVGFAVVIGIFQQQHLGSAGNDHPVAPGQQAIGEKQPLGEQAGAIEEAIAVGVFENADGPAGFGPWRWAGGIIRHLHYP